MLREQHFPQGRELRSTTTDAEGRFAFDLSGERLRRDMWLATVVLLQREEATTRFGIEIDRWDPERNAAVLDVADVVARTLGLARVRVVVDRVPVGGASVQLAWPSQRDHSDWLDGTDLTTDAEGRIALPLTAPFADVSVSKAGLGVVHRRIGLRADADEVSIELTRAVTIEGRVVEKGRGPIAGARVTATAPRPDPKPKRAGDYFCAEVTADADGRFAVPGLTAGHRYTITVRGRVLDAATHEQTREIDAPSVDASFTLSRSGPLVVKLAFDPPRPKQWGEAHYLARIERLDETTGVFREETLAPESHRFLPGLEFRRVRPGTYRVVGLARMVDAVTSETVVVADGGGEVTVSLKLATGRSVAGRVVDETGTPIEQAVVYSNQNGRARGEPDLYAWRTTPLPPGTCTGTAKDGTFLLGDVPDDDAELLVWRPRHLDARVPAPARATRLPDIVLARIESRVPTNPPLRVEVAAVATWQAPATLPPRLRVGPKVLVAGDGEVSGYLFALPDGAGDVAMVWVPPGDFVMGGSPKEDDARFNDEKPRHVHAVKSGYWIARTETTWAQYRAFCRATKRSEPAAPKWGAKDDHPVVNVTWNDAKAFCDWAGLTLPTEAQWEKAARGTDGRRFPWGAERPDESWCASNNDLDARARQSTAPTGSFPRDVSPYGALDMAANVGEWCSDAYDVEAYPRYLDGEKPLLDTGRKSNRGGSWWAARPVFERGGCEAGLSTGSLGLRPALGSER